MLLFTATRSTALWTTLLLTISLSACGRQALDHQARFFVFGTIVDLTIRSEDPGKVDQAFSEIGSLFQAMHKDLHPWEPGLLTEVNQAFAEGRTIRADQDIVNLVRRSQEIEAATGGRFDPAIGGLIGLWGFHTSEFPILGPPPGPDAIQAWVDKHPSSRDIHIDGLMLSSSNPAVQLDFGGIAKGYAIDRACLVLQRLGLGDALVNAGGDLRTLGHHGNRPWRVAIRNPHGGIIGTLESQGGEAIFTSGNYERFRQDREERYPHILDPRTGWPVRELSSVTVVASEGLLADAAATALTVAGTKDWAKVASSLGVEQVLVVDEAGTVYLTPAMRDRVQLEEGLKVVVEGPGS